MKKKNGFTLVELLAVIVILGVVISIATVSVISLSGSARKGAFGDQMKVLFKTAQDNYTLNEKSGIFDNVNNPLNVENGEDIEYSIAIAPDGTITCLQARNDTYQYYFAQTSDDAVHTTDTIGESDDVEELNDDNVFGCEEGDFDNNEAGTLMPGNTWWKLDVSKKSQIHKISITNRLTLSSYDEEFNIDDANKGTIVGYVNYSLNILQIVNKTHKRNKEAFKANPDSTGAFAGFENLEIIEGIKLIDFKGVTNMKEFFKGDKKLTSVYNLDMLNTKSVVNAQSAFENTGFDSLLLSRWDTGKLTNVQGLFKNSTNLSEVDISGWDSTNITSYSNMFTGCTKLVSIYASPSFDLSSKGSQTVFGSNTNLRGGGGTVFSASNVKSNYAKCDNGGSNKGYFTDVTANGILSAKLYDVGSISAGMTYLSDPGVDATPWDYYKGERLLEIDVNYIKSGTGKNVEISLAPGLYFADACRITKGSGDAPAFTKLASQGTGSYENAKTGTYKIGIANNTSSISIQCKVMFDAAIWNKNASANDTAHPYMFDTSKPAITVSYSNGTSTTKRYIKNVKSATGIGNANVGYSFYSATKSTAIYSGVATTMLDAHSLLNNGQISLPSFYKEVAYSTYAYCTNASGSNIENAVISQGGLSGFGDGQGTGSVYNQAYTSSNPFKRTFTNVYNSGGTSFLRPAYKVSNSNCKYLKIHVDIKLTSYSGQISNGTYDGSFEVKPTTGNPTDVRFAGSSVSVATPPESYLPADKSYINILGYSLLINTGYQSYTNVNMKYEFDNGTAIGSAPKLKVSGINLPMMEYSDVPVSVTLIDKDGKKIGDYTYHVKCASGTCNAGGNYVHLSVEDVKKANSITKEAYFKKIDYKIPKILGGTKTNYLYGYQAERSIWGGGTFAGRATANATTKITMSGSGLTTATMTANTSITNSPGYHGYVSDVKMPNGSSVNAGDYFELDIKVEGVNYPYTDNGVFTRPELYLILPDGITINSAIIVSSPDQTSSEVNVYASKLEESKFTIVNGVNSHIYKLSVNEDIPFGYLRSTSGGFTSLPSAGKWYRIKLKAAESMDTTTMNIRENLYFKDAKGYVYLYGAYGSWNVSDKYDVDNNGNTGDMFATTNNSSLSVTVNGKNT